MPSSIPRYELCNFEDVLEKSEYVVSDEIKNIISIISLKVGSPIYNKTPYFARGNHSNEPLIVPTKITKPTDCTNDIRKHLNKLTRINYKKLSREIITIITENRNDKNISKIVDMLFEIVLGNMYNSEVYAKLFVDIRSEYDSIDAILKEKIVTLMTMLENIETCNPAKDYDLFCKINKDNEKRRSLLTFIVNLMDNNVIEVGVIVDIIVSINTNIQETIKLEGQSHQVEEYSEMLFILTDKDKQLKESSEWDTIMLQFQTISSMKRNSQPSLTSKTIFKHMDILDKLSKKELS